MAQPPVDTGEEGKFGGSDGKHAGNAS